MKKLTFSFALILTCMLSIPSEAQEHLDYQLPPSEILQLADYKRPPSVTMDSKKENMLYVSYNTYKTLLDLNQEEVKLGGLRINPIWNLPSTTTFLIDFQLGKVGGVPESIQGLPKDLRATNLSWSPNEAYIAFIQCEVDGAYLWLIDVKKRTAKQISKRKLNGNMGSVITWDVDSKSMLIKTVIPNRPALIDRSKDLPTGPVISNSDGQVGQNRTFQDLLKNPTDEVNFETLVASEIYRVSISGNETMLFPRALYSGISISPNGEYMAISTVERPFSYIVPYNRFAGKTTVYQKNGKMVKEINAHGLRESMPKGFMAVNEGKRSIGWRSDKPATLFFVEALDGGDPAIEVEHRDEAFLWDAPFNQAPYSIFKTVQRFAGITWGDDEHALVYDMWYDTRNSKTFDFAPGQPEKGLKLIWDRNYQDVYSDPGDFEMKKTESGRYVLDIQNNKALLIGEGHTPQGQFPFIDEFDFANYQTVRKYQSAYTDKLERLVTVVERDGSKVLVNLQSPTEYPNYYFRNLNNGELTAITSFENPFASLNGISKEVIEYKRKDGLDLTGTLYLPAGYDAQKDGPLPLLIWAYPREYKDKNSAGQNTQNPNAFTYPYYGSFVYWVTRGYAVLDDAAFPIVGEGETEPNDNFIDQLVADAEAAINAVVERGVADPKRVAIGGHSYGAFMTANLLTHSNLFACGIARSGAYNRTLTPFGFQSEQRNYWEASDIYNTMSPFMHAEKMKTPLLLVHGEADNNPGTFTLQTERYFQALKGLGAPVRMVILPKESHGYVAKENILHLLWEQDQFLEKYLKNKE